MKYVILVGDGMAGYPVDELGGRTTLEAAATPEMDALAATGELFTLTTVPDGMAPGSDVANLSLLGYRPDTCYTGRAPLEAASMGVELAPGETAFRCNLVTVEHGEGDHLRMLDYSAGHITTSEAGELITALAAELEDDSLALHPGVSYRHLLVTTFPHDGLVTAPPHDHTGKDVTELRRAYDRYAFGELIRRAEAVLAVHPVNEERRRQGKAPANSIWLWGEGRAPAMERLSDLYGISGALISAVDLLKGIGVCAGMEVIDVPGATGYLDTNYEGKAQAAVGALERHDLVFVHVEAPDEAGHQGLLQEKIRAIEDFDARIVGPVRRACESMGTCRLAVTCDHFTPLSLRTHAAHPVPVLISDQGRGGGGGVFSEQAAVSRGRTLADGPAFMGRLLGGKGQ